LPSIIGVWLLGDRPRHGMAVVAVVGFAMSVAGVVMLARFGEPEAHDAELAGVRCQRLSAARSQCRQVTSRLAGMKLKLDLHEIYNRGADIDHALRGIIDEAIAKRATLVEIIPGKGSGQLKKRVLRFLDQKEIKALYHRVEKDSKNFGRLFVHFKFESTKSGRSAR
jgi:DNA-nicking Smr family endonuclease